MSVQEIEFFFDIGSSYSYLAATQMPAFAARVKTPVRASIRMRLAAIDAPESKDHLRATTDEAVRRGAFGAPSLFVGDALSFGNDRLPLLEEHLAARGLGEA